MWIETFKLVSEYTVNNIDDDDNNVKYTTKSCASQDWLTLYAIADIRPDDDQITTIFVLCQSESDKVNVGMSKCYTEFTIVDIISFFFGPSLGSAAVWSLNQA